MIYTTHTNLFTANWNRCSNLQESNYLYFCLKLPFRLVVVNYLYFFLKRKTALLYPQTNSPFFELKHLAISQFTTFTNNLNIAREFNFRYI